ncbi:YqiA/YcfP family alpha/beta fold hydrolase [Hydrogenimonas cancrithermarum]|uniref:Esterase YqiA n=1 Tax=Hydrogenimonas cancrithermarum TaxID=2993563 RepID=A0ABM8FLG8_9BACT|nr:YqiA/YcfP family alpha/beta fold hydrolase [Hydrogenimonas cancrithermarum]BDY13185.1 esterase YqiA [Hydrogenimonas cancrithermarum]
MIVYIHGFASSGLGAKARLVREHFKSEAIAPSLSYVPDLALDSLKQLIEKSAVHEPVHLIGSSLGGFYAIHLAETYDLKAVLVNPSIEPYNTLAPYVGTVTNFYDLTTFEWNRRHVESLRRMKIETATNPARFLLMLQTGDETLDYRVAKERLPGAKMIIEEGGSHAFDGFENHFRTIETFFKDHV